MKSILFVCAFIFLCTFSFSSAEISKWDNKSTGGVTYTNNTYINETNIYQNVTEVNNYTMELNTTQFETGEPVTIKTSWLTSFIEAVSKWGNYWTKTENINQTGYNITASYFKGDGSLLTGISAGGGNPFNQVLNTTSNVVFNTVTTSNLCYTNGTNCPFAAAGNPFNQVLNTTSNVTFARTRVIDDRSVTYNDYTMAQGGAATTSMVMTLAGNSTTSKYISGTVRIFSYGKSTGATLDFSFLHTGTSILSGTVDVKGLVNFNNIYLATDSLGQPVIIISENTTSWGYHIVKLDKLVIRFENPSALTTYLADANNDLLIRTVQTANLTSYSIKATYDAGMTQKLAKITYLNYPWPDNTNFRYSVDKPISFFAGGQTNKSLAITIPQPNTEGIFSNIEITGYDYTYGVWRVMVSGFHAGSWNSPWAYTEGYTPFDSVRFAYNGTLPVILLGNLTTSWGQGFVMVRYHDRYGGATSGTLANNLDYKLVHLSNETGLSIGTTIPFSYHTARDYYLPDNRRLLLGTGSATNKDAQIYYDGTNLIFNTNVVGSGIAYFSNNVSATGFVTRTSVYDKSEGSALDLVKDADTLTKIDLTTGTTEIDHKAFYGYTQFEVTDFSRPEFKIKEQCDIKGCKNITTTDIIYPYKKLEDGVDLGKEIDVLRQALYELKTIVSDILNRLTGAEAEIVKLDNENTLIKQCIANSKTFEEFKLCNK